MSELERLLTDAERLAERGRYPQARRALYALLRRADVSVAERARIERDLAVIAAVLGHGHSARLHARRGETFRAALESRSGSDGSSCEEWEALLNGTPGSRVKVAIVSLLFNWPSTGGGTVHTKELADFLSRDGYDVRHVYAVNADFQVGQIAEPLGYSAEPLEFQGSDWSADVIRDRFRRAVAAFSPDWVIVTDSWSTKPLLAEAVRNFPYFLRLAAQECLCPLNNSRLLVEPGSGASPVPRFVQCGLDQLSDPAACGACVAHNGHYSGGLHKAERLLGGFHADEYRHRLRQAFEAAEGVLVVNPEIARLVAPHVAAVHVVPSGFDRLRFPVEYLPPPARFDGRVRFLFAGLAGELMKGFHVLRTAAQELRQRRDDFEIWVTSAPPPSGAEAGIRYIGWQSQAELTHAIVACDALVFPCVSQEALGRSAVEALGCGRPVIASRIGGLDWVVEHERHGLLCPPGDATALAAAMERLLDDPPLRERLGRAGQEKFQREFTWEAILSQHYRPLFGPVHTDQPATTTPHEVPVCSASH